MRLDHGGSRAFVTLPQAHDLRLAVIALAPQYVISDNGFVSPIKQHSENRQIPNIQLVAQSIKSSKNSGNELDFPQAFAEK
jgi:hypothetical protein